MFPLRLSKSVVATLIACATLSACGRLPAASGPATRPAPPEDLSTVPDCQTPQTAAFGLGLTEFESEPDAVEALRGVMPLPDPATLPPGTEWVQGYYNAGIVSGVYKQSTMALAYRIPALDEDKDERYMDIMYYSTIWPFAEPREPHETMTVRGGKTAYLFEPPFQEGMLSLWWLEDCRQMSVIGTLTRDEIFAIAEGLGQGEASRP